MMKKSKNFVQVSNTKIGVDLIGGVYVISVDNTPVIRALNKDTVWSIGNHLKELIGGLE